MDVVNYGGSGEVEVRAWIEKAGDRWEKSRTLIMNPDETEDVKFVFKEVSLWPPKE